MPQFRAAWDRRAADRARTSEGRTKTFVPQNTGFGGGLSEVNPRAREQEVGADHEPEGVSADDRYLDEHARDRKHHHQERDYNPNVHCAYLLALRRSAQNPG